MAVITSHKIALDFLDEKYNQSYNLFTLKKIYFDTMHGPERYKLKDKFSMDVLNKKIYKR